MCKKAAEYKSFTERIDAIQKERQAALLQKDEKTRLFDEAERSRIEKKVIVQNLEKDVPLEYRNIENAEKRLRDIDAVVQAYDKEKRDLEDLVRNVEKRIATSRGEIANLSGGKKGVNGKGSRRRLRKLGRLSAHAGVNRPTR